MLLRAWLLAAGLLVGFSITPLTVAAETPVSCGGKSLVDEIEKNDPAAYQRIRDKAAQTKNGGALFWKVDKPGVKPSWLLGTAHVTDQQITTLPEETRAALEAASTVALEIIDMSEASVGLTMMKTPDLVFFTDGSKLASLLTPEEFATLSGYVSAIGINGEMLQGFKPWMVATFLALSPCEIKNNSSGHSTLDDVVESTAKQRGIKRVGLETIEEQFRSMSDMAMEAQIANLKLSIALYDRIDDSMATLKQLYLDRRIAEMFPLLEEMLRDQPQQARLVIREFQLRLIDQRNQRMRERALPLLEQGNAFVAVGALHLPGDVGLVELLRQSGYKLTPVN